MNRVAPLSWITVGQALAGMVALFTMLLFTQPGLAGGGEHRTLQLLLNKGIITQQEYDQAVQEEERAKVEEEKRAKVEEEKRAKQANFFTKNGLQVRLGGFAEFDFISDNTQSFQELVGNRPVLHSNTVNGANSQFFYESAEQPDHPRCASSVARRHQEPPVSLHGFSGKPTGCWNLLRDRVLADDQPGPADLSAVLRD